MLCICRRGEGQHTNYLSKNQMVGIVTTQAKIRWTNIKFFCSLLCCVSSRWCYSFFIDCQGRAIHFSALQLVVTADNLVQIAHNVIIGKHCLIVAQSGIAGSTKIGNYVILAAQSGLVGHLEIGDGAIVMAQSGVSRSIKAGEHVFGSPAHPIKDALRNNAHVQRLDQSAEMIKDLKKRIEELEKK